AFATGNLEAARYAFEHADAALSAAPALVRARTDARRAYFAFMTGDDAEGSAFAQRALAAGPDDFLVQTGALPVLAIAAAKAGRTGAGLARVPFHTALPSSASNVEREGQEEADRQNDAWVESAVGKWRAAAASSRAALEHAHAHDWNRAEAEAWLGQAL